MAHYVSRYYSVILLTHKPLKWKPKEAEKWLGKYTEYTPPKKKKNPTPKQPSTNTQKQTHTSVHTHAHVHTHKQAEREKWKRRGILCGAYSWLLNLSEGCTTATKLSGDWKKTGNTSALRQRKISRRSTQFCLRLVKSSCGIKHIFFEINKNLNIQWSRLRTIWLG